MSKTKEQYQEIISICRQVFEKKMADYGTSWRIMRPMSLTDQIYIKASRIKSIELKGKQLVEDDIRGEYIGMINYSIIALIQLDLPDTFIPDLSSKDAMARYESKFHIAMELMLKKNHDYNEAWRTMRVSSYTDLILMKINRIKQIEDNQGKTIASEGIDANYYDIINYSVFALIQTEF